MPPSRTTRSRSISPFPTPEAGGLSSQSNATASPVQVKRTVSFMRFRRHMQAALTAQYRFRAPLMSLVAAMAWKSMSPDHRLRLHFQALFQRDAHPDIFHHDGWERAILPDDVLLDDINSLVAEAIEAARNGSYLCWRSPPSSKKRKNKDGQYKKLLSQAEEAENLRDELTRHPGDILAYSPVHIYTNKKGGLAAHLCSKPCPRRCSKRSSGSTSVDPPSQMTEATCVYPQTPESDLESDAASPDLSAHFVPEAADLANGWHYPVQYQTEAQPYASDVFRPTQDSLSSPSSPFLHAGEDSSRAAPGHSARVDPYRLARARRRSTRQAQLANDPIEGRSSPFPNWNYAPSLPEDMPAPAFPEFAMPVPGTAAAGEGWPVAGLSLDFGWPLPLSAANPQPPLIGDLAAPPQSLWPAWEMNWAYLPATHEALPAGAVSDGFLPLGQQYGHTNPVWPSEHFNFTPPAGNSVLVQTPSVEEPISVAAQDPPDTLSEQLSHMLSEVWWPASLGGAPALQPSCFRAD